MLKDQIKRSDIEIMAPAGSFEALTAAINAGADSVYFGAGTMNMRSRSSANFSLDDLTEIASICHKAKVKSYLTMNTIIYGDELELMKTTCDTALAAGIDAVIAADIAVIQYASSIGLPVHISVQANVSNSEAVKFFANFADVMVLARELTLPQIAEIIQTIEQENITGPAGEKIKIELFAHGALCVAVSGKCYMSLGNYNSSANRGACFQTCRRAYRVTDEETGEELVIDNKYVMSPKDICTINIIDRLLETGVKIFKIEGRGRSADYVSTVTAVYREAIEAWFDGTFDQPHIDKWLPRLETVFNRGFWMGGYYLGEKLGEWTGYSGNRATETKHHIGKVNKYFTKIKVAEIVLPAGDLKTGSEILIIGPTTGTVRASVNELRRGGEVVSEADKGSTVSLAISEKVRPNDKVYLISERRFGQPV
jgi:putative protease